MRDQMASFIATHLKNRLGEQFIHLSFNTTKYNDVGGFFILREELKKSKSKLQITDISAVQNTIVNFIRSNRTGSPHDTYSGTGIYDITFSNGHIMTVGSWFDHRGNVIGVLGGTEESWKFLWQEQKKVDIRQEKPKMGIYTLGIKQTPAKTVLTYDKVPWTFKGTVIHAQVPVIENEIEVFFNHVEKFSRYGQVPFRKIITIGAPGTGKSSINFHLAERYGKNACVIFSQDINNIFFHMKLCAKHDVPTIIFYDDAENILQQTSPELLNFLSGSNTPNVKKGCMLIFTSNMTDYIEDRVLRRPGRIDRIIEIAPLIGDELLQCAKMYFDQVDWSEKTDQEWIDMFMVQHENDKEQVGLTGAEIQGLAQTCYVVANSKEAALNFEFIKEVKHQMGKDLKDAYNMMAKNSMAKRWNESNPGPTKVGFKIN